MYFNRIYNNSFISTNRAGNDRKREEQNKRGQLHCTFIKYLVLTYPSPVAAQHKEIVTWLVPGQHNVKHDEACSRWKETGRCSWILENETFMKWCSDGGFLWLHGIRAYNFSMLHFPETDESLSWERQVHTHVSD